MSRTRRSVLLSLVAALVGAQLTGVGGHGSIAVAAGTGHTSVQAGTRIVLRDGVPFIGKGYTYWPQMIGDEVVSYQSWADPATCENDARLLEGAGATLIRPIFEYWLINNPGVLDNYHACADSFHNHGIGLAWLLNIAINDPGVGYQAGLGPDNPIDSTLWVEHYWAYVSRAIAAFKDHPATNFWVLGNETDGAGNASDAGLAALLGDTQSVPPKVGLLEPLFQRARAADPDHLVGHTASGAIVNWRRRSNVPSLQFWGLNLYSAFSPGSLFSDLVNPASPRYDARPNIVTEFGTDRYFCQAGFTHLSNGGADGTYDCVVPGSGEAQLPQARYDQTSWDNIAAAFATPSNPNGTFFGGMAFTYTDQWNYSLSALNPVMSSSVHDVLGTTNFVRPDDGYQTFEWWGVAHAQARISSTRPRRVTSLAFDYLADRWTGTPGPRISNASLSYDANCRATLTWDTTLPADSEVQNSPFLRVLTAAGTTESDSMFFESAAGNPTPVTHHVVTMGFTIPAGIEYAWAIRSTLPGSERTATHPPLIGACPA